MKRIAIRQPRKGESPIDWTTIFWYCFWGGLVASLVLWLLGDWLGGLLDGIWDFASGLFQPVTLIGAVTAFGASGLILSESTPLAGFLLIASSLAIAVIAFFLLYYLVVRPVADAESSTAFRLQDLAGRQGEVLISIPGEGCGEVLVWTGSGNTNQIASSHHGDPIPLGTRVIVQRVEDSVLWVAPVDSPQGVNKT
ncbi:NfeD family protein [Desmospora profundinema]|uniref:Membrane protein implicated in regulation of membrane protease activity n=1 Tax=Desmospora profundinema TaxID=1571184 RepID=A0ABU1IT12_9BACL|nr:NfeD family protein [Desmospora profundinema]MDR6227583.1 membrane protein implicated in regulation of membrane protease activity [Desmospora profundinema]